MSQLNAGNPAGGRPLVGAERPASTAGTALAVGPVLVVVVLKTILNLAFSSRYGWQRDELYYAIAGRHLQGGYVEFPPVTALFSALARELFGFSLTGFRLFAILAGAATSFTAALVARELDGGRRAQVIATVVVAFSPLLLATNGLFQPVSFDQLTTMALLLLALRLALGRGSWPLIGLAVGIGLETKYTLSVVLVMLIAGFVAFRRDVLTVRGVAVASAIAIALAAPNLVWEARHGWISVHWFLHPPGSATDESRPGYIVDLLLNTNLVAVPVAGAGIVLLWKRRSLRPLAIAVVGTVLAYFFLGGKSYYALPVVFFALACGAVPFDAWATRSRLIVVGAAYVVVLVVILPVVLPVLPQRTAIRAHVFADRSDYMDEVGWPQLARQVGRLGTGSEVVIALNYGEAGALEVFGRGLPPVASGNVTFRYWRPRVTGRRALLVGLSRTLASRFCDGYRVVGRILMPVDNEERGRPIADCTLAAPLGQVWPRIVELTGT